MSDFSEQTLRWEKERILEVVGLVDLYESSGLAPLRRCGNAWWVSCPFHAERSASFKIEERPGKGWRYHCFGCGVDGDAISFWMKVTGLKFMEACGDLAKRYGLRWSADGDGDGDSDSKKGKRGAEARALMRERAAEMAEERARKREYDEQVAREKSARLVMPALRRLSGDTMRELAGLRGLSVEGVRAACDAGVVWGGEFGVSRRYWAGSGSKLVYGKRLREEEGRGMLRVGPVRCWFAAEGEGARCTVHGARCGEGGDETGGDGSELSTLNSQLAHAGPRVCAAVRRLDGGEWERFDGGRFKSWAVGSKAVPLGVFSMGEREYVMVVEGEGDLLAAYHFLAGEGGSNEGPPGTGGPRGGRHTVENTAVVCVLGAASSVPEGVWALFKGRRVRLFPHFDEAKCVGSGERAKRVRAGWEGAFRWQEALERAGAEVDCFWFGSSGLDEECSPVSRGSAGAGPLDEATEGEVEGAGLTTEGTEGHGEGGLWWVDEKGERRRVKDLNDAARGDAECLRVMEEECFGRLWRRACAGTGAGAGPGEGVTGALTRFPWMAGKG